MTQNTAFKRICRDSVLSMVPKIVILCADMIYVLLILASIAGIALSVFYLRKNIIRIKEKRAEDKAKKEQKAAEKEAKRAAKEIAKQRKKAEENGYAREKSALRDRINSILRNDAANNAASSKPAPEQNVTVVLPSTLRFSARLQPWAKH